MQRIQHVTTVNTSLISCFNNGYLLLPTFHSTWTICEKLCGLDLDGHLKQNLFIPLHWRCYGFTLCWHSRSFFRSVRNSHSKAFSFVALVHWRVVNAIDFVLLQLVWWIPSARNLNQKSFVRFGRVTTEFSLFGDVYARDDWIIRARIKRVMKYHVKVRA